MTEKELEIPKTTSSKPFPQQRSARRKKKDPTPSTEEEEAESEEEEEVESSSEEPESKEAEPSTPPPEKRKKIEIQASNRKKPATVSKTPVSLKRPTKTSKKGESSQKKPRGK